MKDAEEATSANGKGNRAYYTVFYAVSALLALDGMTFKTHGDVEGAVHQQLVHTGRWKVETGDMYKRLHRLRVIGDYGWFRVVSSDEALEAVSAARNILDVIRDCRPDVFNADLFKE